MPSGKQKTASASDSSDISLCTGHREITLGHEDVGPVTIVPHASSRGTVSLLRLHTDMTDYYTHGNSIDKPSFQVS